MSKSLLTSISMSLIIFTSLLAPPSVLAQKSVAEFVSSISPPRGKIQFTDGVRQITKSGNYLLITDIWAGLQVVDIQDMKNPRQVAFVRTDDEAYNTTLSDNYAFLANAREGVQVYDIANLPEIHNISRIQTPANALAVAVDPPNLFVAAGNQGVLVYNISDIKTPVEVSSVTPGAWIQYVYKKDNLLYLAAKKGGLIIYDFSQLDTPRKLVQYRTGFNAMKVQVEGTLAYIADGPGGLLIMNVENPQFPVEVSRIKTVGFVGDLVKVGNYVYLANRDVGLQIVNVIDPQNPFLESIYPTDDKAYGVFKQDIHVFLAANTAAFILRHNNAPQLHPVSDQHLKENALFTLQLQATEPDGDPIVFEARNLPEGAEFEPQTGLFTWTPTYEQAGTYPDIIFRVIEQTASKLSASDTISLFVENVNRLPDLPALENRVIDENTPLTIAVPEGSDPDKEDQNRLSYRAEKLPDGATFDPSTRTFQWTPTYDQSGVYVVDFLMDDGNGGIDREPVTITVNHVDRKPTIDSVAHQVVDEAQTLTIELTGTELDREDQDKISFRMENLPEGATFDPATHTFTWTPTYDQSGEYPNIVAIMRAGQLSDTTSFSITVNHVNRPPVLAAIPNQSIDENQVLTFTISGSDPDVEDAGKLSYSAANLPEGATFDPTTLTFSWQPTFEQSGVYSGVSFTVTDPSGLSDSKAIVITVHHVNRPPTMTAVEAHTINENEVLQFQLSASDPDKEDSGKLTFSGISMPEGATLNSVTGEFQWTPTYEQSGEYAVTFIVSDGQYQDSTRTTITVNHVNRPPVISLLSTYSVDENQPLTFMVEGSDPDKEDSGLLTFAVQNLPEGAAFNAATRTFNWTPTYEQSGEYSLVFTVTDPAGLIARQPVTITVNHVNRPPVLAPVADMTAKENEAIHIQLSGSDPDREDAGKLVYAIANLPGGATLDPATGAVSWQPTFEQSGIYKLTATVNDPAGLSASQSFTLTVTNVNRPPRLLPFAPPEGKENELLTFALQARDPDKEDKGKLQFSAENLPEGAKLNPTSGEFSWTPTYEQSGSYPVVFKVQDSFGDFATSEAVIHIVHVNRPPSLPSAGPFTFTEGKESQYVLPAGQDPDAEDAGKLTYQVENAPRGLFFGAASRKITWKPDFDQAGEHRVIYKVSDGLGHASQTIILKVANVNRPPTLKVPGEQTVAEGKTLTFHVTATDPDKEDQGKLKIKANNLPAGAKFDKNSGAVVWTPTFEQAGNYTIQFVVTDKEGLSANHTVSIQVVDVPRASPEPENPGGE